MRIINKKGDATDMLILVISIFFLAMIFLTYWYFTTTTATALEATPLNTTNTQAGIQSLRDLGVYGSANGFMMIMGALFLALMISSFLIDVHPIFIFIYIIMLIMTILVAVFLGNAYAMITAQEPMLSAAQAQPQIDAVMRNIVRVALVAGVLSIIVVFAKIFGGSNQP
jgi:hypothetical protein